MNKNAEFEIARKVREAAMSGLCMDGAAEAAIGAMQSLDLEKYYSKKWFMIHETIHC